jgi:hypothetical protein
MGHLIWRPTSGITQRVVRLEFYPNEHAGLSSVAGCISGQTAREQQGWKQAAARMDAEMEKEKNFLFSPAPI